MAGASIGAAVGALAAGPLTDRFGRKSLLIVDAAIYAVGAILSAVAVNTEVLRRGALMITPAEATGVDWRIILGIGALPAVIALALRTKMPESPRWLMSNRRYADTRQALAMLGMDVTEKQVRDTAEQIAETERQLQRQTLWTAGVKRALWVVCGFFVFQQITGINVPFYYGPQLLGGYLQEGKSAVDAAVAGVMAAGILGVVNVVATFFAFRYIDKIGRRRLAIGGFLGMAVSILVAALGVATLTGVPRVWVVMIGFSLFITAFAIGVGGTGWLIQGEVFPTAVRGRAAAACASVDWLANFVIIQWFPTLNDAFGLAWVMVLFAALSLLAVWFVARFLPETKGMALEDVTEVFERQAAAKPAPG